MESNMSNPEIDDNQTVNLPPELKLLYMSLTKMVEQKMQPIEKIENNMKTLLKDRELLPEYVQKVQNLEHNAKQLTSKVEKIEQENQELKQKLVRIEDKLLENNLVISGIEEPKFEEDGPRHEKLDVIIAKALPGETTEEKLEKARKLDIVSTVRLGKYNPIRGHPISVAFVKKADADHVYNSKKLLGKGIYVDREYSSTTESERKRLRPILRAARRLDEYRGLCKLEGTELTIKGKRYSFDNLHDLPANISTHVVSSRQNEQYYGFFGEYSPLSNFHPAPFTHEGVKYHTSEQYIQKMKADFCKDRDASAQIMLATTPYECKKLGRGVKNCNAEAWNSAAMDLCYPGILSKFVQNPGLSSFLRNTGNKTILECCYDDVWGNGIPLSDPRCLDPKVYEKQGILGFMLENIRRELNSTALQTREQVYLDNPSTDASISCGN